MEEKKVDEVSILDKEKVIEKQKKFIEEMEKDIALKRVEIDAWRKHCLLFWEENPSNIFDPNNPHKTTKADSKGHEGGKEGMIRKLKEMLKKLEAEKNENENVATEAKESTMSSVFSDSGLLEDTSTAGVFGDTEDMMDTTHGPESHEPLDQRVPKRKRLDKTERDTAKAQKTKEDLGSPIESKHHDSPLKHDKIDMTQKEVVELNRQMEMLRKEHSRQLEEQEQKSKESMESLRQELDQKNRNELDSEKGDGDA